MDTLCRILAHWTEWMPALLGILGFSVILLAERRRPL